MGFAGDAGGGRADRTGQPDQHCRFGRADRCDSVGDATGLDFLHNRQTAIGTPGTISLGSGSTGTFAAAFNSATCPSFTTGGCGTIKDLTSFSPSLPIDDFYTISLDSSVLTFELTGLSIISQTIGSVSSLPTLAIAGQGIFDLSGYDPTPGIFTLTTQGPCDVTFSATTDATRVPEPATLGMLGFALVALGTVVRRRRRG
ncbi:MAG TPA: PEP-CTERM sorting domain-containing protein [Acetobacteraceae bacterium]|jgi:hypothetical protein